MGIYLVMSARNDRYTNARKLSRLGVRQSHSRWLLTIPFCHLLLLFSFSSFIFFRLSLLYMFIDNSRSLGHWLLRVTFHEFVRVGSQSYAYIDVPVRYTKAIITMVGLIYYYYVYCFSLVSIFVWPDNGWKQIGNTTSYFII